MAKTTVNTDVKPENQIPLFAMLKTYGAKNFRYDEFSQPRHRRACGRPGRLPAAGRMLSMAQESK
jgi:hypothetical protein